MKAASDITLDGVSAFQSGGAPGGGLDAVDAALIARGSTLGLEQRLLSQDRQPGLTVLAVGYTTGKVQGCSLGPGNVVEMYASGADFNANVVLHREFMEEGEEICFTDVPIGAIITSTKGFYGFCEQVTGSLESNMPLLSYGLAFRSTLFNVFRSGQNYDPGGSTNNQGWIHVVNGPLANVVELTDGSGVTVEGQEGVSLEPWQYHRFYSSGNKEYRLSGTQPMMACTNADMGNAVGTGSFRDSRHIMPGASEIIGWGTSSILSAEFDDTAFDYYIADGAKGSGTVSPGSPVAFANLSGATDPDYEPPGLAHIRARGFVTCFSGADSAGSEATAHLPTYALSHVVAQPLHIDGTLTGGDGGNGSIAVMSEYEGTAQVFSWDRDTATLVLEYTLALTRVGFPVVNPVDQRHPCAHLLAINESGPNVTTLTKVLRPGIVKADVPIAIVCQNSRDSFGPSFTIRSQGGTTTTGIKNSANETLSLGVTPAFSRQQFAVAEDGFVYRRRVVGGAGGGLTWQKA